MKNHYASNSVSAVPYRREYKICFEPFEPLPGHKVPRELSVAGAVLLQQLDYWFAKYPKGFYKFTEPPASKHKAYKLGDSWTEELAFSRREFSTAFEQIGVAYKSKKQFKEAKAHGDVFQGRFYCSYFDRIARITWYYRNHAKVDAWLEVVSSTAIARQETTSGQREMPGEVKSVNDASAVLGNDASSVTEVTHPPFDSTETTSKDYSTETTLSTTTRAKPKKKGGGSEREGVLISQPDSTAKEIAEWICAEFPYQSYGVEGYLWFNCTKPLVAACKGHTKETARDAVLSYWEAAISYAARCEAIEIPERFLALKLREPVPVSAKNRQRILDYERQIKELAALRRSEQQTLAAKEHRLQWLKAGWESGHIEHYEQCTELSYRVELLDGNQFVLDWDKAPVGLEHVEIEDFMGVAV